MSKGYKPDNANERYNKKYHLFSSFQAKMPNNRVIKINIAYNKRDVKAISLKRKIEIAENIPNIFAKTKEKQAN